MVVCANVRLAPSAFVLGGVFDARPGVRVELERVVPIDGGISPFVWIDSEDREWASSAVGGDDAVERVEIVDTVDDGLLLRVSWRTEGVAFLRILSETNVACLDAAGTADGWSFHLRYPSHDAFSTWCHQCSEQDIELVVESVRSSGRPRRYGIGSALTEAQREALTAALAHGYFSIPRKTTLQTLSDRLGISDTAASQRIRRGIRTVLSETL